MPGIGQTPLRKRAGQRRHRVSIEQGTEVKDSIGGESTSLWTAFGSDWAAIEETPNIISDTEASLLYRVTLKYRSDVRTRFADGGALRVVSVNRTLKVLQIENPEERNIELILHCSAMAAA